jgi:AraC-like DNA-binding protein
VVTGAGTFCHVAQFADPISIKSVSYGEVEWRFDHRRYLIRPDTLLLLPDGDEYSLTIDSAEPTRGFCAVFRRGLVEECWRAAVSKQETLLDAPFDIRPLSFQRRLESRTGSLGLARQTVEDDLATPWTLVTMARAAMMAPHHFHRCFRMVFGETPRGWLSRRRAERAMALLRTTSRSVIEICLTVGYESASSFSSSFAARYGMPPSRVARPRSGRRGWAK